MRKEIDPRIAKSVLLVLLLLIVGMAPGARAMNCDVDGNGSPAPTQADLTRLTDVIMGTAQGCAAGACDFDGNGKSPDVGDMARYLQGLQVAGTLNCTHAGMNLAFTGQLGALGRRASSTNLGGASILAITPDGQSTQVGIVSPALAVDFTLSGAQRYTVLLRPFGGGADIPFRFPTKKNSTSVLPLDGVMTGALQNGSFNMGELIFEGGEFNPTNNPLRDIRPTGGNASYAETTDQAVLGGLAQSEETLTDIARQQTPNPPVLTLGGGGEVRTTNSRVVNLSGTVTNFDGTSAKLEVNGRAQTVRLFNGNFSETVVLASGTNTVRLCAGIVCRLVTYNTTFDPTDLWVQLSWLENDSDVDLYITDPSGETAYYDNQTVESGGYLDVDNTEGYGPEAYYLSRNEGHQVLAGTYSLRVHYYADNGPVGPIHYRVVVIQGDDRRSDYAGVINTASGENGEPQDWLGKS